jgi:hypothetical protein
VDQVVIPEVTVLCARWRVRSVSDAAKPPNGE